MRRAWAIALLFPLQLAAQGPSARVTGLRVAPAGGATEIVIQTAGGTPGWRGFTLENPSRVVIDVENARAQLPSARFDGIDRGGVTTVRASQFGPTTVRIAVDLERAVPYTVTQERDGIHVRLATGAGAFTQWTSAAPGGQVAAQAQQQPVQQERQEQPRITVTFQDADIRDVLATIAEFSGRSIVPGTQVTGTVSVATSSATGT
jgi:hypothetical protein